MSHAPRAAVPSDGNGSDDEIVNIMDGFRRLALENRWGKKSQQYKTERAKYIGDQVHTYFKTSFGYNPTSLQAWQHICWTVGVEDGYSLTSIKMCKEKLKGIFVNIVDLVDASNKKKVIERTFSARKALAKYIQRTGKIFPKKDAKLNPLLSQFLIVVR
ncbi:hypothetical protein FISHEDRAFT_62664 [Fistulina hepatica ATCC 64428]|nr:hypothetical protein FISHEDRAFT_62664 [Fistulina hepatica ATCC 64428]